MIVAALYIVDAVLQEGAEALLKPGAPIGRGLTTAIGLRRDALDQIVVLVQGFARLTILVGGAMIVARPLERVAGFRFVPARRLFRRQDRRRDFVAVVAARRRRGFGDRHGGDPRRCRTGSSSRYLPRTRLDAGVSNSIRTIFGYVGVRRRAGGQRRSARPRLPEAGDRRRRAVGRHRLRLAVDRQQFRFRPDPVVGARHQGRRLGRGRRRSGLRAAHQRARHRDRDLRPRHADRAQRDAGQRPGEELDARRPHRPHRRRASTSPTRATSRRRARSSSPPPRRRIRCWRSRPRWCYSPSSATGR